MLFPDLNQLDGNKGTAFDACGTSNADGLVSVRVIVDVEKWVEQDMWCGALTMFECFFFMFATN